MKTAHQQASPALPPRRLPLAFQGVCQAAPEPACTLASPNLRAPRTSGPELASSEPDPPGKARRPRCARSHPKRSGLTPHPQGLSQLDISQGAHWVCGSLAAGSVH